MTPFRRKPSLSRQDLTDAQELVRILNAFDLVAKLVKGNTALVPQGKKLRDQLEAIVNLLTTTKNEFLGSALLRAGLKQDDKASVNIQTGEVTPLPKE